MSFSSSVPALPFPTIFCFFLFFCYHGLKLGFFTLIGSRPVNQVSATRRVDAELTAAQAGDRSALGRLFQGCRAYLLSFAHVELDPDLAVKGGASDLVQQTLLEAQQAFGRFGGRSEDDLLRWLRRILKNNLLDHARRFRAAAGRNIRQELALDGDDGRNPGHCLVAEQRSPLQGLLALEKRLALERGLAQLPEELRRVIDLRNTEERTFAEIGALLGKSAEAARKLWVRALKLLRQELKRHEEFGSSS